MYLLDIYQYLHSSETRAYKKKNLLGEMCLVSPVTLDIATLIRVIQAKLSRTILLGDP